MPWRYDINPYHIFVSEIMLQQTQVDRVRPKFEVFVETFPTLKSLAIATLQDVYKLWIGLGYNRRAIYLRDAAKILVEKYDSIIPQNPSILLTLPGIGKATAGAICVYAYNLPVVFIETNIRATILFTFFQDKTNVPDAEISNKITKLIDKKNPREWYYAVVDYGEMLKKKLKFPNVQSKTYSKQSKFEGSDRQIRGAIMRIIHLIETPLNKGELYHQLLSLYPNTNSYQIDRAITSLLTDRLLLIRNNHLFLSE